MSGAASGSPRQFKRLFLRGFAWTFTQSAGGFLVQAVTLVVLSRLLTPAEFGTVAIAMAAVGVVSLIVELGVGPALIQQRVLNERHIGSAVWISMGLATLLMIICQLIADPVARYLGIGEHVSVLRFLTLIIFLAPLKMIPSSLARREFKMRLFAAVNLIADIFGYAAVAITLALLGFGFWSIAIAQVCNLAMTLVLLLWAERGAMSLRPGRQEARDVLSFGTYFSIARVANYAAMRFDRAMVGSLLGVEAAGHYQRVQNVLQLVGPLAAAPLDAIMFPLLSRLHDDAGRLRRSYRATTAVAGILAMPASILMAVAAPVLIPFVLGPQWDAVVLPAQIMSGMLFFRANDSITGTLLRSVGRVKERAVSQVLFAILSLSSIYVLKDFGLPGIAAGLLCVTALNFLAMSFLIRHVTTMSVADNFAPLLPGVLGACAFALLAGAFYATLGTALFTTWWMVGYVITGSAAYVCLLALLPASWFPGDVADLRATLLRKLREQLGSKPPAAQLDTIAN
jgi:O-antigen/teichoic acid export membrane protein